MVKLYIKIILSVSFFFLHGCTENTEKVELFKQASLQEILTIGGESEPLDGTPVLSMVFDALTDGYGNIHLVDPGTNQVHSYDMNGSYLRSLGGKGEGPGEFQSITSLTVDGENRLYVYDSLLSRLTVFTIDGDIYDMYRFKTGRNIINQIILLSDNRIAFPLIIENKLVHIYSLTNEVIEKSIVDTESVLQTGDDLAKDFMRDFPGRVFATGDGGIIYVPLHYGGIMHLYEETQSGEWHKKKEITGYRKIDPALTFHLTREDTHDRSHLSGINPFGSGYVHYEFHSVSFGLYQQNDGTFVHLSYEEAGDEMHLVVEYFNIETMELQAYFIIDDLNIPFFPDKRPVWADREGYIFIADHSEWPALRKMRID